MFDLIIIGSGPAGLAAAIYATRREMRTLVIGRELGGQVIWAGEIENYPGISNISSFDFIDKLKEHSEHCGAEIISDEVKSIERQGDGTFIIRTNKNQFQSQTIVVAMGLSPRRLVIPGEIELSGKGVSYCANCDGPLFKGKTVAVIGGGNSAFDAAEYLSKIVKKVYLINRSDEFKAFESLIKEVKHRDNVEIITNVTLKTINGEDIVSGLSYQTDQDIVSLTLEGVFIEIGRIASTDLVAGLVDRDERMQIIVNNKGETRTPGVFAAGDVTNASEFKQISIAVGQATIAALAAYQYLQRKEGIDRVIRDY